MEIDKGSVLKAVEIYRDSINKENLIAIFKNHEKRRLTWDDIKEKSFLELDVLIRILKSLVSKGVIIQSNFVIKLKRSDDYEKIAGYEWFYLKGADKWR